MRYAFIGSVAGPIASSQPEGDFGMNGQLIVPVRSARVEQSAHGPVARASDERLHHPGGVHDRERFGHKANPVPVSGRRWAPVVWFRSLRPVMMIVEVTVPVNPWTVKVRVPLKSTRRRG